MYELLFWFSSGLLAGSLLIAADEWLRRKV